ncbi:hypothetical protein CCMSSC00406_0006131 [Pleurotus cornucopiae]|uniref:Uncharacterized protein n=1 Tax=Pleurotus cornucopiae TaxID=5321 RepID=A0ACB7JA19_PLECO|nr:hypothetical protein CCMSSC00406_0006131 [Pleurotus cornucopiae]
MFGKKGSNTDETQPPTPSNAQPSATSPAPISDTTRSPHQGQVNNTNQGNGTFNNVHGRQNVTNGSPHHGNTYGGDHFAGSIQGGNVGGRGNNNAIYNNAVVDPPRRDIKPRPSTQIQQLQAKIEELNSKIDRIMEEMGWNEEKKLQRMVDELEVTYRGLQREA